MKGESNRKIVKILEDKLLSGISYLCNKYNKKLDPESINTILQVIKFLIIGVYNFVMSYMVYALCVLLGCNYLLSNGISFCFSVLNSFFCSKKYVFKGEGNLMEMLLKVAMSYIGTGLILQSILLAIWIEWFEISALLAPILNICIITPLNFIIQKFWAYK